MADLDRAAILGALQRRGVASSQELQSLLGRSQPTVSRLLGEMSGEVVTLGNARARRYGLPKSIHGLPARQPIYWTTEAGATERLGDVIFLAGGLIQVTSKFPDDTVRPAHGQPGRHLEGLSRWAIQRPLFRHPGGGRLGQGCPASSAGAVPAAILGKPQVASIDAVLKR